MSFRRASVFDALPLYQLRQAAEQKPWYEGRHTTWDQHTAWLQPRLTNELVKVLIWDDYAGAVRIESNGEISFDARTDGVAVEMLRSVTRLAGQYGERLKATVDADDPRAALLEQAGFTTYPATALVFKP